MKSETLYEYEDSFGYGDSITASLSHEGVFKIEAQSTGEGGKTSAILSYIEVKMLYEALKAFFQDGEVQDARQYEEYGKIAMKFVDRAGDYCEVDPAEKICDEFYEAIADKVDYFCAMRGMPSEKYNKDGTLK